MDKEKAYELIEAELIALSEIYWDNDTSKSELSKGVGYLLGYSDGVYNCLIESENKHLN